MHFFFIFIDIYDHTQIKFGKTNFKKKTKLSSVFNKLCLLILI